jgi:hypothetical protein
MSARLRLTARRNVACRATFSLQHENQRRTFMFRMSLIAAGIAFAWASPAAAQATEYYVVQDVKTKKCMVVDKKPTTQTTVVVSNGVFKTRTEAETGLKKIKVCTTN